MSVDVLGDPLLCCSHGLNAACFRAMGVGVLGDAFLWYPPRLG